MTAPGLVDVLLTVEGILDRLQLRRSYGGAFAYNFYAPPRYTHDIDLLVLVPDTRLPLLLDALTESGAQHGDPPHPIELREVLSDLRSKKHLTVFQLNGVPIDLFVPWHPFHERVLQRSPQRNVEGRTINIHAPEDLVVIKKIFNRPKDLLDIRALLTAQRGSLDTGLILKEAKALLTDPSFQELEELIRQTMGSP